MQRVVYSSVYDLKTKVCALSQKLCKSALERGNVVFTTVKTTFRLKVSILGPKISLILGSKRGPFRSLILGSLGPRKKKCPLLIGAGIGPIYAC